MVRLHLIEKAGGTSHRSRLWTCVLWGGKKSSWRPCCSDRFFHCSFSVRWILSSLQIDIKTLLSSSVKLHRRPSDIISKICNTKQLGLVSSRYTSKNVNYITKKNMQPPLLIDISNILSILNIKNIEMRYTYFFRCNDLEFCNFSRIRPQCVYTEKSDRNLSSCPLSPESVNLDVFFIYIFSILVNFIILSVFVVASKTWDFEIPLALESWK